MLYPLMLATWAAAGLASAQIYARDSRLPIDNVYRRAIAENGLWKRGSGGPRRAQSPMQRAQNIPVPQDSSTRPTSPGRYDSRHPSAIQMHPMHPRRPISPPLEQQIQSPAAPPAAPLRPPRPASPAVAGPAPIRYASIGLAENEAGQIPSNHHEDRVRAGLARQQIVPGPVQYESGQLPSNSHEPPQAGRSVPQSRVASPTRPSPERASRSEDTPAPRSRVQATMLGRESLHSQLRLPPDGLLNANIIGAARGPLKIRAEGNRGAAERWRLQAGETALIGPGHNPTTSVKARVLPHSHAEGEIALVAGGNKEGKVVVDTGSNASGTLHFMKPEHLAHSWSILDYQTGTAAGEVEAPPGHVIVAGSLKGPGKIEAKAEDFEVMRRSRGGYSQQDQ